VEVEFELAEEFLLKLKKEFGRKNKELIKVAKLKRIEQGEKIMKEFIQKFRKAARKNWIQEESISRRI